MRVWHPGSGKSCRQQAGEFYGRAGMPGGMEIGDFTMIELKHVTKKYRSKTALEDVSLLLPAGGDRRLVRRKRCAQGQQADEVDPGLPQVQRGDHAGRRKDPAGAISAASRSRPASTHFSRPWMPKGTRRSIRSILGLSRKKRFDALIEFFELPANRAIGKFSTGQKNQFEVLLALSQGADEDPMDEPFAGNDIFNRKIFIKYCWDC